MTEPGPFRNFKTSTLALAVGSILLYSTASILGLAASPIAAFAKTSKAEQPLTLKVLNYESFSGPDLQAYMMRMKESIRSKWHPKSDAPHAAKIFFQVFGDGSLLQHSVQESSGSAAYDNDAKSLIESLAPFGPPPPGNVRLMNIVAIFGTDDGASVPASASNSGGDTASAGGSSYGTAGSAYTTASTPSSPDLAPVGSASGSSTRAPLEGQATETGTAAPKTKMLQGEASAEGQGQPLQAQTSMNAPPMYQGQAMSQAPPMYQGQAMAQAPPMFQAQTGMQAPMQAMVQNPAMYQVGAQHGQMTIGVLGCEFGMLNNQIRQILPGSDLLRYGFVPGDIIEAADGQRLRGKEMQAYIRGTPGTYVQLSVLHQGQIVTVPVMRKDTRMFQNFSGYFRKWAGQERFW
ncbi:MAG TPA: TonB C-terminal domain-containing protein [Oculatellaceae cyanobacterium]